MMAKKLVVAIDGPAGAGKSTVAQLAAKELGYTYIDTGAMYRAVAWKALKAGEPLTDEKILTAVADIVVSLRYDGKRTQVFVDGEEVTNEIRTPAVSAVVSQVARLGPVREKMVEQQRRMADAGGVLMDGRDIATHVLPNADVKIFLTASLAERAKRRWKEMKGRENMPKEGPVILAANHMSNWDPPLLATFLARPVSYMAKQELFFNFIADYILRSCHSFPVKRGAADRGAIKAALAELKKGHCLGVFPQGTRSRHGERKKAEPGVALLAAMAKAPVVPAAIIGTDHVFANGGFLPKLRVIYGKPLIFQGEKQDKQALQDFSQKIMDEIYAMIKNDSISD